VTSAMRRTLAIAAAALVAVVALTLGGCALGLFAGTPPANLGVKGGRLAACPGSPNCVSSQADPADGTHYIAPIAFKGDGRAAWRALRETVAASERVKIVGEQDGYLRAEFATKFLGFVDDVEFVLDAPARVIHVRSASRLGYRDFGVNRARIEALRTRLAARTA
jgi:uncharacterized protein (DUF1499 family)